MAPADPGGTHCPRRPPGIALALLLASAVDGIRLLPAVLADVRDPPGVVPPVERRLRGSRRAQVHGPRGRACGVGKGAVYLGVRGRLRPLRLTGRPVPADRPR